MNNFMFDSKSAKAKEEVKGDSSGAKPCFHTPMREKFSQNSSDQENPLCWAIIQKKGCDIPQNDFSTLPRKDKTQEGDTVIPQVEKDSKEVNIGDI